jgi:hypothetical protein
LEMERRSFDFVTPYPDLILLPFRLHKSKTWKWLCIMKPQVRLQIMSVT